MLVDCPKCFAGGELRHFSHIEGGVCFLCRGARQVSEAQASRWLAAQAGHGSPSAEPEAPRPTKVIELAGFGPVRICRFDAGRFRAGVPSEHGCLDAWFHMSDAGNIILEAVSDGLKPRATDLRRALQGALRRAS
jgi:hypothetical protein